MTDALTCPGIVVQEHRGDLYAVDVTIDAATKRVLAKRSGRLVQNYIRLIAGDRVTVEISPYDTTRGRIVARERLNRSG